MTTIPPTRKLAEVYLSDAFFIIVLNITSTFQTTLPWFGVGELPSQSPVAVACLPTRRAATVAPRVRL